MENLILLENKWRATSDTMVCAPGANISCTRIWKGTMQLWFHTLTDGDSPSGLNTFKYKGLQEALAVRFTKLPQHCNLKPFSLNMGCKLSPFGVLILQIYSPMCQCGVYSWQHEPSKIHWHSRKKYRSKKREMCFCLMGWIDEGCRENHSHIKQDGWRQKHGNSPLLHQICPFR